MDYGIYYHKTNKFINITYNNTWFRQVEYLELRYSSLFESYAIFFCTSNQIQPIFRVYDDDRDKLHEMVTKAITDEILDLSEYYSKDDTDFALQPIKD